MREYVGKTMIAAMWLTASTGCGVASQQDTTQEPGRGALAQEETPEETAPEETAPEPRKGSPIPCAVATVLAERCLFCHGDTPLGAPFSLTLAEDFQGESYSDPDRTMTQVTSERVNAEEGRRMPPAALGDLTAEELKTLNDWLEDGAKSGAGCGGSTLDAGTLDAGNGEPSDAVDSGSAADAEEG